MDPPAPGSGSNPGPIRPDRGFLLLHHFLRVNSDDVLMLQLETSFQ